MDPKPAEGEEQAKKRRGRKKSKLEDMFPAYLQVCKILNDPFKNIFRQIIYSDLVFVSYILCYVNVLLCRRLSLAKP